MTSRADVVVTALTQLGVRWQHQARLPGKACDCIGLVLIVGLTLGLADAKAAANDPVLRSYDRQPDPESLYAACDRYLDRVADNAFTLGDILVMKMPHPERPTNNDPQHFGIVSRVYPYPYMVHALAGSRKVAENRIDDLWRSRIVRVYRFRGLTP